jgi:malonyl-CoA/methylmalonyl-CoA synthetase
LSDDNLVRLRKGDEVYIGVLAAGGYEFTVAMVAILAIGAAVVPMSKSKISMKIQ